MIIFDEFPTIEKAAAFATAAREKYGRRAIACTDRADEIDLFPSTLTPPVVYVDRDDERTHEDDIAALATEYGGTYAGT